MRRLLYFLPFAAFLGGLGLAHAADVIPSGRRFDATVGAELGYGVPGGIYQYRSRTVVNATGIDTTGATDMSGTIKTQLDALSPGQCLLLPAGTIRISTSLSYGVTASTQAQNNITLRGAGMGSTTLMLYGSASIGMSGGGGELYDPGQTLAADVPAGATTATLSGTGEPVPGLNFELYGYHDPSVPLVSAGGGADVRPVYLRCTAQSGNTMTFFPPLPFEMKAGARLRREIGTGSPNYICHATGLGMEDLTIDGANTTAQGLLGVAFTDGSWLYNVEVKNANNSAVDTVWNLQLSIIHCKIHNHKNTGSYSSRELLHLNNSTLLLIEDNIIHSGYCAIESNAVILSAFSHNFIDRIALLATIGSAFNINHGPHSCFNTYEGNITPRIQSDGYFGGSSDEMIHRNWIHGTNGVYTTGHDAADPIIYNRLPVTLNRFSRNFNLVGNMLGRTGVGITWDFSNVGPGFDTTSSTSMAIGTGSKSFTFGTGLGYNDNGTGAIIYSASDPTKWMSGRVFGYNSGTGACSVTVYRINGSGTFNDWIVKGGGGYGNDTIYTLGGPIIGNGGVWFDAGSIVAPQTLGIWWPVWDGRRPVRRGDFNSGTVYNQTGSGTTGVADVVGYFAQSPYVYNGGNNVFDWIANNPAKAGTNTWATPGPEQTDWLPLSSNSYVELDYDAYGTGIFKDNWNARDNGIHTTEAIGSDTYPVSRIRSGSTRPAFFGSSLTYPAFDSHSPNQSFEAIPAGYRYVNNAEVPGYNPDDNSGAPAATRTLTTGAVTATRITTP